MNLFNTLSIVTLLLLTGCNSSTSTSTTKTKEIPSQKSTSIQGKSTLAKATICIDINRDSICNENEPQTISNDNGVYQIIYNKEIQEGSTLLAEDGFNLVLLEENNLHLALKGFFSKENKETNINTITTLISNSLNSKTSYIETKKRLAKKYNLDVNFIEKDPLLLLEDKKNQNIFLTVRAIENNTLHPRNKTNSLASQKDENTNIIITEEEADNALLGFDIFDFDLEQFKIDLADAFLLSIFYITDYLGCLFDSDCTPPEYNITLPIADENDTLSQELVPQSTLRGIWRMEPIGHNKRNSCLDMGDIGDDWFIKEQKDYGLHLVFKAFHYEDRKIDFRQLFLEAFWETFLIYKSENKDNTLYMSTHHTPSIWGDDQDREDSYQEAKLKPSLNYKLTHFDTLSKCIYQLEEDEDKDKGELARHAIIADFSETKVTRTKLNGVWYQRDYSSIFEINNCLEIKANNTMDKARRNSDIITSNITFNPNTSELLDKENPKNSSTITIKNSSSSENILYFIEGSSRRYYKKMISQPDMETCLEKL